MSLHRMNLGPLAVAGPLLLSIITVVLPAEARESQASQPAKGMPPPTVLRVQNLVEPVAIETRNPAFSWVVNSDLRGDIQTAYRIIVSSSRTGAEHDIADLWDSGKRSSRDQNNVRYGGAPLQSASEYFWKLRTWNKDRKQSEWSSISRFVTGMLNVSEWKGKFLGKKGYQLYRKEFSSDPSKQITSAFLFVGSLGVPVVYINGKRVGDAVLNSAESVIKKTTWYRGFDAGSLVHGGKNALGVMMGTGQLGRSYGNPDMIKFILNLVIKYHDGTSTIVSSDGTWKATKDGPLVAGEINNVMDGEKYDARNEQRGWTEASFNDSSWEIGNRVLNVSEPGVTLKSQPAPPMKAGETLAPAGIREVFPGIYTVDAGENMSGWVRLTSRGKAGDRIDIKYAETISSRWNDYNYSARINLLSESAGMIFRAADENNYYCWTFTTAGKIRATKKVKGSVEVIREIPYSLKPDTDYNIEIRLKGNVIETYIDNVLVDTLRDGTFQSGKVGFCQAVQDTAIYSDISVVNGDTLLKSDGRNPELWLNNESVQIDKNRLKVSNSSYLVSRFGNVDGGIDQSSLSVPSFAFNAMGSGARQHDYYIHGEDGTASWEPFQTIHGFRYAEVRGLREPLTKANVKIRDVYQAVDEDKSRRGAFSCSNDLINRLYAASLRSYRSNLQWGKPTDCVGRDERGGWTGDAEMQSQAGYYYTDMTAFYEQWLVDMRETQHSDGYIDNLAPRQGERAPAFEEDVAWSSVAVNLPWDMYNATGDRSVIEKQYESMKRFLDWCVATSNLGKGKEGGEDYTTNKDCWGDWGSDLEKGFCCPETRPEGSLFATAFFYQSAVRLASMAEAIGQSADSKHFKELAAKIRLSYNKKFFKRDSQGAYYLGNSQTVNALSVALGLCPEEKTKREVVQHLVASLKETDYTLTVGVLGLYGLFDALCENGYTDVAYKIATKETYPSWGDWIKKGATSTWEFWDGHGSRNHGYLGGKLNAFFVKYLAGISPSKPGYEEIQIKPFVAGDLQNAKVHVFTTRGLVCSDWVNRDTTGFHLNVEIPVNSTAKVHIPLLGVKSSGATVTEGGTLVYDKGSSVKSRDIGYVGGESGYLVFTVGSGKYSFILTRSK